MALEGVAAAQEVQLEQLGVAGEDWLADAAALEGAVGATLGALGEEGGRAGGGVRAAPRDKERIRRVVFGEQGGLHVHARCPMAGTRALPGLLTRKLSTREEEEQHRHEKQCT